MTAIKHKHSPASGAAGGWAAHPPLDPCAAEIEVRLHVYISNCWNEEELQFPAANLSGIQSSASALSPGRRRRCPLPFGDAGKGKHAAAPLTASAQALSRGWQGGLSPYPAGKLKKSYFVLGRIQEPLKSWERSAGQANPSLLSLPAFQSHSAGISPRRGLPHRRGGGEPTQSSRAQGTAFCSGVVMAGEVTVEEIPQSCVQDKPSPTLLFACCPRSASPTPELALTLLGEKLGRGGDPRISGVCLSWEQCRNERQRDPGPPRHIPEQNPRHVVSGHLWSWHSVALGPTPYLPCSSSFLEPLLYHILSIPST